MRKVSRTRLFWIIMWAVLFPVICWVGLLVVSGVIGCVPNDPFVVDFPYDGGDSDSDADTDTDADSGTDSDTDSDTDTETNQTVVATCAEYLSENPGSVDGEYPLYVGGDIDKPWDAYCYDMAGTPVEYLTLIHTGTDYNFSQYTAGGYSAGTNVRTHYYKLHIDPGTFEVNIHDGTFSASVGSLSHSDSGTEVVSMCYASSMDCISSGGSSGIGNIDLVGTPFKVADSFCQEGTNVGGGASVSSYDQVVDLTAGGTCGWIVACPSDIAARPFNQGCTSTLNLEYSL